MNAFDLSLHLTMTKFNKMQEMLPADGSSSQFTPAGRSFLFVISHTVVVHVTLDALASASHADNLL